MHWVWVSVLSIANSSEPPHNPKEWVPALSPYYRWGDRALLRLGYLSKTTQKRGGWSEAWLVGEPTIAPFCVHGPGLSPLSCQSHKHLWDWPRNHLEEGNETKILWAASQSQTLGSALSLRDSESPGQGRLTSLISWAACILWAIKTFLRLSSRHHGVFKD